MARTKNAKERVDPKATGKVPTAKQLRVTGAAPPQPAGILVGAWGVQLYGTTPLKSYSDNPRPPAPPPAFYRYVAIVGRMVFTTEAKGYWYFSVNHNGQTAELLWVNGQAREFPLTYGIQADGFTGFLELRMPRRGAGGRQTFVDIRYTFQIVQRASKLLLLSVQSDRKDQTISLNPEPLLGSCVYGVAEKE
jgi:hypothetical protein